MDKTKLKSIIDKFYENVSFKKQGNKLIIKPDIKKSEIPSLDNILSYEFYGLDNEKLTRKKTHWLSENYLKANPLPRVKNMIYASKGVKISNYNNTIIAPYVDIDCPNDFIDKTLNPLRNIIIDRKVFIGEKAQLKTTINHGKSIEVGPIIIKGNSIIGGYSTIGPSIINNSIIGAYESFKGCLNNNVVSHKKFGNKTLPEPLLEERLRFFESCKNIISRLKKRGEYKDIFIEYNKGSQRIHIKKNQGDFNYSKNTLYNLIMKNNILSAKFELTFNTKMSFIPHNIPKMFYNRVVNGIAKLGCYPLVKATGIRTNKTKITHNVFLDYLNPQLITIKDNVKITDNSVLTAHYYIQDGLVIGLIHIDSNSVINGFIMPGTYIGKGSKINGVVQGVFY